jgi:hypothetical protein
MKKQWHRPELVVLVRHQPQEVVLQGCKVDSGPFGGLGVKYGACDTTDMNPAANLCDPILCLAIVLT